MSKANVLASLATDVNELSSLADQISEIEGAIEQANTNFHAIQSLPEIPEIPEIPPPVLSFRNKIINGNFAIWQRGTTSISPHSGYQTADRWYLGANIGNSRNNDSPAEFQYSLDVNGSVADSNGYALLFHRIESKNIISSIGKKLTLSAYVRNIGTSTANVSAEIYYPNSTDNWAAQTLVGGLTTQAITNEWSRIVFPSFDVPADANKGLEVRIFRYDASNSQQWRITGVQLEEGEVATPFEHRPLGLELSLCKRYYQKSCDYHVSVENIRTTDPNWTRGVQSFQPLGGGYGTQKDIRFSVQMRSTPTIYIYSPGTGAARVWNNSLSADLGYTHVYGVGNESFYISAGGDNSADGTHCHFHWNAEDEL